MGPSQNPNFTPYQMLNSQTPKGPLISQPNILTSNSANVKRPFKPEQDQTGFVMKKLKTEGTNLNEKFLFSQDGQKEIDISQYYTDTGNKQQEYSYQQGSIITTPGNVDRNVYNSSLLNNILVPNNNQPNGFSNGALVIPILQTPQGNMQQPIAMMTQQGNPMNNVQISQMLQQSMKPKQLTPGNAMNTLSQLTPTPNPQNESKKSTDGNPVSEGFMKEFQNRIMGLLFTQNKMLIDLKEKNEILQDTLACLINEINVLKGAIKINHQEKTTPAVGNPLISHQVIGNSNETVTVDHLTAYLYGNNPDFHYQLILKSDLPLPLYRERNFKFTVILTDKKGNPIENSNRIPLTIGIYSSENPPKFIDSNTAGNKILKGFIEKDLVNGSATFEKIQIKEVTSHFRNGWVFFVVYPKLNSTNNGNTSNGQQVNPQKIKPLILEKVVVKAKKAKEKDGLNPDKDDDKSMLDEKEEEALENKQENDEIVYS